MLNLNYKRNKAIPETASSSSLVCDLELNRTAYLISESAEIKTTQEY